MHEQDGLSVCRAVPGSHSSGMGWDRDRHGQPASSPSGVGAGGDRRSPSPGSALLLADGACLLLAAAAAAASVPLICIGVDGSRQQLEQQAARRPMPLVPPPPSSGSDLAWSSCGEVRIGRGCGFLRVSVDGCLCLDLACFPPFVLQAAAPAAAGARCALPGDGVGQGVLRSIESTFQGGRAGRHRRKVVCALQ